MSGTVGEVVTEDLHLGTGLCVKGMYGGDLVALYLFGTSVALSLLFMVLIPVFIMPLFNKFEDLKEGTLKMKIEDLARELKFPLKKLYVCDASKRSSHSNAFFYGFGGNKRIVLFDTLIDQHTEEEIVAIVAHELGHWYHNHTLKNMAISFLNIGIIFFLFSLVINQMDILSSFGF